MHEELIENLGLTRNESRVYIALLKQGKARSGEIVKAAKISGGKVYETLYKLAEKGLVKIVTENGVKHFFANDPKMMLQYLNEEKEKLNEREQALTKVLPELEALQEYHEKLESVSLIKGMRGISVLVNKALEEGKNIRIMGVRSSKDEKYNAFWKKWHKERAVMKKPAKILFSDTQTSYWDFFKSLKYTEVKNISAFSPSSVMIIDENVFIFSYEEDFMCIHISLPSITNSFVSFFDSLWSFAKN